MAYCFEQDFSTEAWRGGRNVALIDFVLNQECTIRPWLRSASGEDIYGEPETRKCRLQTGKILSNTTVYIHSDGAMDVQHANAKMYCTGEPIPNRSIVECGGRSFIVLNCYEARGFTGDHLEVQLQ